MTADADCDYVIVGSGAGGGTLAARLAEAGMNVVVLEAGDDACAIDAPRLPTDYQVPAFHPFASENPAMSWDFFVRHYADEARQRRDPKYIAERGGVFYPRGATLGGCTAHNAMILLRPHSTDWDDIAALTGDASWRATAMQRYWQRLENCRHREAWRWLARLGIDPTGHGWDGWLTTEQAKPPEAFADDVLITTLLDAARAAVSDGANLLPGLRNLLASRADPNDLGVSGSTALELCYTPLTTNKHQRTGTRERLLDVAARHPGRLRIELHALATRVLFDAENRATDVEYLKGERLYRASSIAGGTNGELRTIHARREVILSGGAFNTPQLLMLSGIGPPDALAQHRVPLRVPLPGVGRNLQDRYEVGVVNRMQRPWRALDGARFDRGDPLYREWHDRHTGMYVSNGAALAASLCSAGDRSVPDLFCMALLARFPGYFPGYSREIAAHHDYLTWALLKAHTNNRSGTVTLGSNNPRDPPVVDFHYFDESNEDFAEDLRGVVAGIRFVRTMTEPLRQAGLLLDEELPGDHLQTDEQLAQFVCDNAWGHHASCSCAIGPNSADGVLDSRLRVHGTSGLRVVDASVFPRIPGFFVVSAIYMVAEKAADMILQDAAPHQDAARNCNARSPGRKK